MTDLLEALAALGPRIRELAPVAEEQRRLPAELAQAFGRIGLWRACAPMSVGGLEVPLHEQMAAFEQLARADGAAGWCAMIGATGSITYASLQESIARELIAAEPLACTSGVFAPLGRAVEDGDAYRVSGRWPFGSGVEHSARMSLGVVLWDEQGPKLRDSGAPEVRWALLERGEFEIVDTWTVSGLRGTGSHDVAAHEVLVPRERFTVLGRSGHPGPLFAFPFFGLLALAVASVGLGIARSSVDELSSLAAVKTATGQRRRLAERPYVQMQVAEAEADLRAARAFYYDAIAEAWRRAESGAEPTLEQRATLRLAATHAMRSAARVVDRMYEAGGGTSNYATSRLQRDFRDIHAATQHAVVAQPTMELAGRVLLGVETEVSQL
jgi:alkylation response protein AidB-like acyl-CoA dehydrogenase